MRLDKTSHMVMSLVRLIQFEESFDFDDDGRRLQILYNDLQRVIDCGEEYFDAWNTEYRHHSVCCALSSGGIMTTTGADMTFLSGMKVISFQPDWVP